KLVATAGTTFEPVQEGDKQSVLRHSTIKVWDANTGELKKSLGEEKNTQIRAIAFSPDSVTLAIATWTTDKGKDDHVISLLDAETLELKHKIDINHAGLRAVTGWTALAFSPDGKRLALGAYERKKLEGGKEEAGSCVKLWDVQNKKLIEAK